MKKILIPSYEVIDAILDKLGRKYGFPSGLLNVKVIVREDNIYEFEVKVLDE